MQPLREDPGDESRTQALTAQLHTMSAQLAACALETRRSRVVAAVVRSIHQLGVDGPIADDLAPQFLQVVVEQTLCDTAVLLQAAARNGEFLTISAIGYPRQSDSGVLLLPGVPHFLALPGGVCPSHIKVELQRAYGNGFIVWSLHPESGLALILASKAGATIRQDHVPADQEMLQTALALYVDSLSRRRLNRTLAQARQLADARVVACKDVMRELAALVDPNLDQILSGVTQLEEKLSGGGLSMIHHEAMNLRSLTLQTRDLVQVAREVMQLESTPFKSDYSPVAVTDLMSRVSALLADQADKKGVSIRVVPEMHNVVARVDVAWAAELLQSLLAQVVLEAEHGSTIYIESSRRSDGSTFVTIKWVGHSDGQLEMGADLGRYPRPVSIWTSLDLTRWVDAFGGTFIREVTGPSTEQIVVTLSPRPERA